VQRLTGLAGAIRGADLVITGEGSLDEQSLAGKAPIGVARLAAAAGIPVIAVCGRTTLSAAVLRDAGFARVHPVVDLAPDVATAIAQAPRYLATIGARIAAEASALV